MNALCRVSFACLIAMVTMLHCGPTGTVDMAASNFDVKVEVLDTEQNNDSVSVFIRFFFNGNLAELSSNNAVSCNGIVLRWQSILGYAGFVPIQEVNGTYVFRHLRNGVTTSASVTVPARPQILSPQPLASIVRTNNFSISYVAASAASVSALAIDNTKSVTSGSQADNGTYTGLNLTTLNAGTGRIKLQRVFEQTLPPGGFRSVQSKYTTGKVIEVTWN